MKHSNTVPNEVLTPLCRPFASQADWLLELWELTKRPNQKAGKCLRCYYTLLEAADSAKQPKLAPLKQWIEENMEIAVHAKNWQASMPVELDVPTFESFCEQTIRRIRGNTQLHHPHIHLELQYKTNTQAA